MEYWASVVKKAQKDNKNLKRGIIVAARTTTTLWLRPSTADNIFRKMLDLKEAIYEETKQATLSDFLGGGKCCLYI